MKIKSTLILAMLCCLPVHSQFLLGYDFLNHRVDGRFLFSDRAYAGFKFNPGLNTDGPGDDISLNLTGFGRFNLLEPIEGLALGPEGGWRIIRGNHLDEPEFFVNFSADMFFNLKGPAYLYGHIPLFGLYVRAYDNGGADNMLIQAFGYPTELGILFEF